MKYFFCVSILFLNWTVLAQEVTKKNLEEAPAKPATEKMEAPQADFSPSKSTKVVSKELVNDKSALTASRNNQLAQADLWVHSAYYTSLQQREKRTLSQTEIEQINQAAAIYRKQDSKSFEANYYTYIGHRYDLSYLPELQLAIALNPDFIQAKYELLALYIANNKQASIDSLANHIPKENWKMTYFRNLLQTIPQNATLLVHGLSDLPSLYTQLKNLNRSDITPVSLDVLAEKTIQSNLKAKGFQFPNSKVVDTAFFREFCQLNASKKCYLSFTFPSEYFEPLKKDLQIVGLTFAYKEANMDVNKTNYQFYKEKWTHTDFVKQLTQAANKLKSNYLPALLSAKRFAQKMGYQEDEKALSELINLLLTSKK